VETRPQVAGCGRAFFSPRMEQTRSVNRYDIDYPRFTCFETERIALIALINHEVLLTYPGMNAGLFGDRVNALIFEKLCDYSAHVTEGYTKNHLLAYFRRDARFWAKIDGDARFIPLLSEIYVQANFAAHTFGRLCHHASRRVLALECSAALTNLHADATRELSGLELAHDITSSVQRWLPASRAYKNGGDPITLGNEEIDYSRVLLGNRWLSRQTAGMIVAPSGHGKSTLCCQALIEWSAGKVAFGIKPNGPLRITLIQAEDDRNDMREQFRTHHRIPLSDPQIDLIKLNAYAEQVKQTGEEFFREARRIITERGGTDLLIINPLGSYLEGDVKDDKAIKVFWNSLAELMAEFDCGAFVVHHTPKTNFIDEGKMQAWDWMYAAAGSALLINNMRSVLVVWPTSSIGTYKFKAAKRGDKIGWLTAEDKFYAHSTDNDGVKLWIPANEAQIKCASIDKKAKALRSEKERKADQILELLSTEEPIDLMAVISASPFTHRSVVQAYLDFLVAKGMVIKVELPKDNRSGFKAGYVRNPNPVL